MKSIRTMDCAGIGVCVALTGAVLYAGFMPIFDQQAEVSQQQSVLEQKRADAGRLAASLATMREQHADTERAVQANALRLESVDRLNHRLSRVTVLATQCGLEIDRLEPSQPVPTAHYVRLPIRVSGQGGYEASSTFLHRLHEQLPDIAVSSMDLAGKPSSAKAVPTFRFRLDWYAAPRR